ncbi:MAG TPA: hypothetical protein VNI20_08575, partial [Fimbriimonadaceae bacterium]|nr:hypothetical protein [Fimbriimonadaceae bacterium]
AFLKAIKMPTATYASTLLRTEQPALAAKLTVVRPSGKQELRFWMQGGGYDRNLVSPQAILASYNYIQANPVVAGLASSEHEWTWSSAAALFGNQDLLIPDPLPRL